MESNLGQQPPTANAGKVPSLTPPAATDAIRPSLILALLLAAASAHETSGPSTVTAPKCDPV